jgi:hypothetical protein
MGGGMIAAASSTVDVKESPHAVADERFAACPDSSPSPVMPHLALFGQALDKAYPPMTVPDAEILQDLNIDEDDKTLQTGLREAVAIANEARDHGRKRRMSPTTQTSPTTNKENENVVKLVEEHEEATIRSALGRRRSKRKVFVPQLQDLPIKPFAGSTISTSSTERLMLSDAKLCSCSPLQEYSLSHRVVVCATCYSRTLVCAPCSRSLDQAKLATTDHLAYFSQF